MRDDANQTSHDQDLGPEANGPGLLVCPGCSEVLMAHMVVCPKCGRPTRDEGAVNRVNDPRRRFTPDEAPRGRGGDRRRHRPQ
jgi:hypothetical protein